MIEFIIVVIVVLFFLVFLLSSAMLLVISDYVEYATFMAARTYKSGFSREPIQRANAETVFRAYFQYVDGLARNPKLEFYPEDANNQHDGGLIVSYEMDAFYLPPLFLLGEVVDPRITLTAEAHLGRDPSFEEVCGASGFFGDFVQKAGVNNAGNIAEQMDDNGC